MNSYDRVFNAMDGRPVDRTPVSLMTMAWAGHYIGRSYRDYYLDPNVLVESHLALVRDFGMDTVTVQTDPWCEAEAYGMEFDYPEEGVGIPKGLLLGDGIHLDRLEPFDPHKHPRTASRLEAIWQFSEAIKGTVPIIGWVEGPIAEYADLRGLQDACIDLIESPYEVHEALKRIVDNAVRFAEAQIEAGADIIGIGDAAASVIGPDHYRELVMPHGKDLFARIHDLGARTKVHICGNIHPLLPMLAEMEIDILDVDWMVPLEEARRIMGQEVTLCGNFNPVQEQLRCDPETTRRAALRCAAEGAPRFILQAGCETPPGTPEENIRACF